MAEVKATVEREVVVDVLCDRCRKSTKTEGGLQYAKLEALWGYGSGKDLEHHRLFLCEACYDWVIETANLHPDVQEVLAL
jgi:hypothetical protein